MPKTADFFKNQKDAKNKTGIILLYYILAIVFIISGIYSLTIFILNTITEGQVVFGDTGVLLLVSGIVLFIIFLGTVYHIVVLAKGGDIIAERLGGTLIDNDTKNMREKQLVNIVEEMSIASGVPIPKVYILRNEESINAFAAGWNQNRAIVAVTNGTLNTLNREQLQGVIAHEFSHILNSDMTLNMRLMAIISGILVIYTIGVLAMRIGSEGDKDGLPVIIAGFIVATIGYIGAFFGKVIKSAVSRQREYLADASAVEFTRNPVGLAGALATIANGEVSPKIRNFRAEEASHLFFANGVTGLFSSLLATHPPIEKRIYQIDPAFDMKSIQVNQQKEIPDTQHSKSNTITDSPLQNLPLGNSSIGNIPISPAIFVASVGTLKPQHLEYSSRLLADMPPDLLEGAREPKGAMAIFYGLLLNPEKETRSIQLEYLQQNVAGNIVDKIGFLYPSIKEMKREYWLPLLDLTNTALRYLSQDDYMAFMRNVRHLIDADSQTTVFEYLVISALRSRLNSTYNKKQSPVIGNQSLNSLRHECIELISALACIGTTDAQTAKAAFIQAITELGMKPSSKAAKDEFEDMAKTLKEAYPQIEKIAIEFGAGNIGFINFLEMNDDIELCTVLDRSLMHLSTLSPDAKKRILQACTACVAADNTVNIEEAELLRAIAYSLNCPVPPLFASVTEVTG